MKNKKTKIGLLFASSLAFFAVAATALVGASSTSSIEEVKGYTGISGSNLTTTIDLNDTSAADIRSYYSSLNGKSATQRQGTNLLANLKTILKNGQQYFSYDASSNALWRMYEITDRDWDLSPASAISGYNSSTNKITGYTYGTGPSSSGTNPYIHALYVNRNVTNKMHAWALEGTTTTNHGKNGEWCIDREHIWPKSHGFNSDDSNTSCGVRGDPMHLWPGDSGVNSALHSNYYYGYVNTSKSYTNGYTWTYTQNGNYMGTSLTLGGSDNIFEPQDCDKGDIARAVFYLVARYNDYGGSDSDGFNSMNANLQLLQQTSDPYTGSESYDSSSSQKGSMGIMTDLLRWNEIDPPDEWEIHRNNLLYNNYTKNRNPFIDFPEWANYIWGSVTYNGRNYSSHSTTPTGSANPSTDKINGFNDSYSVNISQDTASLDLTTNKTVALAATSSTGGTITWSTSNSSVASISSSSSASGSGVTVTAKSAGTTTITAKITVDGVDYSATCVVTVTAAPATLSINPTSLSLEVGETGTITASASNGSGDVTWSSDSESVATVSGTNEATVTAVGKGTATITASYSGKTATCEVAVTESTTPVAGTYTLTFKTNDSDKNTAVTTSTITTNAISSDTLTSGFTDTTKCYPGVSGLKLGTSSLMGSFTASVVTAAKANIKTISVTSATWYSSSSVADTGNLVFKNGSTELGTFAPADGFTYTYPNSALGSIESFTISTTSKRAYVCSVSFTTAASSSSDSVSLNKSSTSLNVGGTETLVATASGSVTWSSNNESVATVNANGTITAVAAGTATITATCGTAHATCTVTVSGSSPSPIISADGLYFRKITSTSEVKSGKYVIAANVSDTYYALPNTWPSNYTYFAGTSVTVNEDKITPSNATNYIVELSVSGTTVTISNGSSYLKYTNDSTKLGIEDSVSTYSQWTLSAGLSGTFALSNVGSSTRGLIYRTSTYNRFAAYSTSNPNGTEYYNLELFKEEQATAYAATFMNAFTCDNGAHEPSFKTGYSWSSLGTTFSNLDQADREALTGATANESGTTVEQAVARYDKVVSHWKYENFMSRSITGLNNRTSFISNDNELFIVIVATSSIVSVTAIGLYMLLKKRKEQ